MGSERCAVEDALLELLDRAERYDQLCGTVSGHLGQAFLLLSIARLKHRGVFIAGPEDIREDVAAVVRVNTSGNRCQGSDEDGEGTAEDPLLMVCALPPPALKKAQLEFSRALEVLLDAAKEKRRLHAQIEEIAANRSNSCQSAANRSTNDLSLVEQSREPEIKQNHEMLREPIVGHDSDNSSDGDSSDGGWS